MSYHLRFNMQFHSTYIVTNARTESTPIEIRENTNERKNKTQIENQPLDKMFEQNLYEFLVTVCIEKIKRNVTEREREKYRPQRKQNHVRRIHNL